MKFGVTVLLSGFLALASVYYIIQISDQSPQSLMTLASLHYRDTSVKNIHPPDNLISSPGWSYGDRVEILNQKSIENRNYANQSWNYFQRDKLNLIELNEDRDNNFESNENNEFDLSDFDEDAEYHHSDPTVDRFPVYFSKNTLRNKAGEYRKNHDDRICSEAGKHRDFNPKRCLGAPYLYVTYHGGSSRKRIKNICKYTRDGCSLGSVLMPSSNYHPHSLRGMLHHQNFLFVAEAWRKASKLVRFSRCNPALGHRRELLQILVDTNDTMDEGMIHPYGFAKRTDDPYIYVSVQGTYSVLRYNHLDGQPGPMPLSLIELEDNTSPEMLMEDLTALDETSADRKRERHGQRPLRKYRLRKSGHKLNGFYKGTFIDLGNDEVRGIAFDNQGLLYVANKQKGVMVFDKNGFLLGQLPLNVPNPISIYYCKERDSIWIGSAEHHTLYEYDATTWQVLQEIKHRKLKHPAGFVTYGDALYVVSQRKNQMLKFSMVTGNLEDVILPWLPDAGERVLLSPC